MFISLQLELIFWKEFFWKAFRHLYVLATEARWIQTVDVDTGLPVYAPLEVTVRETDHYAESSFCEVTPCLLPERSIVSMKSGWCLWMKSVGCFNLSYSVNLLFFCFWLNSLLFDSFGLVNFLLLKQRKTFVAFYN